MTTQAEIERLQSQLAEAQGIMPTTPTEQTLTGEVEGFGDGKRIEMVIAGTVFECRKADVSWQMMGFSNCQRRLKRLVLPHPDKNAGGDKHECDACTQITTERNDIGTELMDTQRTMILKLLKPHERERFSLYMDEADLEPGDLEDAIGDVIAAIGNQNKDKGKARA